MFRLSHIFGALRAHSSEWGCHSYCTRYVPFQRTSDRPVTLYAYRHCSLCPQVLSRNVSVAPFLSQPLRPAEGLELAQPSLSTHIHQDDAASWWNWSEYPREAGPEDLPQDGKELARTSTESGESRIGRLPLNATRDGRHGKHPERKQASTSSRKGRTWKQHCSTATPKGQLDNSLRGILSDYLQSIPPSKIDAKRVLPGEHKGGAEVFSENRRKKLAFHGYTPEDVVSWACIAQSDTADIAAQRLASVTKELLFQSRNLVPNIVSLNILRRPDLSLSSFNIMLQDVRLRTLPQASKRTNEDMVWRIWDLDVAMLYLVRLLRHSRQVAPRLLNDIAVLACSLLHGVVGGSLSVTPAQISSICLAYNRLLTLFSFPTSAAPFRSVAYRQQAQFTLLRGMQDFRPKIPVTREGYRALAITQVAHKKTEDERRWVQVQSQSWPPWRENKLGIDEDKEYPGSKSRALNVLSRMGEAGYKFFRWDEAAKVLAGWDTDKSPTIQTRSLLQRGRQFWTGIDTTRSDGEDQSDAILWAARIRSTRTLREAWASFCSFKSSKATANLFEIYFALFEKFLASSRGIGPASRSLPGDDKETRPEPDSPREYLYVPKDMPSLPELYDQMLADGVQPAGRLLAILIDSANTLSQGIKFIQDSALGEVKKDVLLCGEKYAQSYCREVLTNLPPYFLASYFRLLIRHGSARDHQFFSPGTASVTSADRRPAEVNASTYAWLLLQLSQTCYLPAWNAFIVQAHVDLRCGQNSTSHAHAVSKSLFTVKKVLNQMRSADICPDFAMVANILPILQESVLTACYPTTQTKQNIDLGKISRSLAMGKRLFVETSYAQVGLTQELWLTCLQTDKALSFPPLYVLMSMVNLCGMAQDHEGIEKLLRWMKCYEVDLALVRRETSNGYRTLRWTLVLARMYLEGTWVKPDCDAISEADRAGLQLVEDMVNSISGCGGWPSEEEVVDYVQSRPKWIQRVRKAFRQRSKAQVGFAGDGSSYENGAAKGRGEA